MMKKCKWMIFCLLLLTVPSYGQDFLCQLSVNSMKISALIAKNIINYSKTFINLLMIENGVNTISKPMKGLNVRFC